MTPSRQVNCNVKAEEILLESIRFWYCVAVFDVVVLVCHVLIFKVVEVNATRIFFLRFSYA